MASISYNYTINLKDEIGRGTFGSVYTALHKNDNTKVAVKKLIFSKGEGINSKLYQMAMDEMKVLQSLKDHPNIVRLLGQEKDETAFWICMEYCDLGNLPDFMKSKTPGMKIKLKIIKECVDALAFMHSQNIVHRDIKPANILMKSLGDDAIVKVSDFGVGKIFTDEAFRKEELMKTMAGTAVFMAPEFFECRDGDKLLQYGASIDVFSLGLLFQTIVLYSPENSDMVPKIANGDSWTPVGEQMVQAQKGKAEFPKLFEDGDQSIKELESIVEKMCSYSERPTLKSLKRKIEKFIAKWELDNASDDSGESDEEQDTNKVVTESFETAKDTGISPTQDVCIQKSSRMQKGTETSAKNGPPLEECDDQQLYAQVVKTVCAKLNIPTNSVKIKDDESTVLPVRMPIPVQEVWRDDDMQLRKCAIGKMISDRGARERKVIVLAGATGTGKSTCIDALMNYILGVKFEDKYRVSLVSLTDEEKNKEANQFVSQTEWVTAYTIPTESSMLDFDICVIDTPGFGDTRGIKQDKRIFEQLEYMFRNTENHGIDCLNAICFIVKASDHRLTVSQKYIFSQILSLFGKDVAENIILWATFADTEEPLVLETMRQAQLPFGEYFQFNNKAFDKKKGKNVKLSQQLDKVYFDFGTENFDGFMTALNKVQPKSLTMTQEVLLHRERLQIDLKFIEVKIAENTQKLARIKRTKKVLKDNEQEIKENENFEYEVAEEKMERLELPKGRCVTNCSVCHETCHANCIFYRDEDKINCGAMTNGKCRNCKGKCMWDKHYHNQWTYELKVEKIKCTYQNLKEKYETAKGKKMKLEDVISQLESEYDETRSLLRQKVDDAQKCIRELDQIALRTDPRSEEEYIDMLIEEENNNGKEGFIDRVTELKKLKRTVTLHSQLEDNESSILGDADCMDEVPEKSKEKKEYHKLIGPFYYKK